jgi:hypothetical protein
MKKIITLIVIFAMIWAVPPARTKALTVLQPVFNRMGPVGDKLSNPMRKYSARAQIASIIRGLHAARTQGRELPDARTFVRWLRANPPSENKELDPWGRSYSLRHQNDQYTISSAGPDGVPDNADDIKKTVTF